MKDIKDLLERMGLPPEAILIVIITAAVFIFFLKRNLDRREKEKAIRINDLKAYARLQEEALLKAYRLLYEQVDLKSLTNKEFCEIICKADDIIMAPFTRYRRDLPEDIKKRIYDDIHCTISQFKPSPAFPQEISEKAKHALSQYGDRFIKKIEETLAAIQSHIKRGIL